MTSPAERERLRAQYAGMEEHLPVVRDLFAALAEVDALTAENARLREAGRKLARELFCYCGGKPGCAFHDFAALVDARPEEG